MLALVLFAIVPAALAAGPGDDLRLLEFGRDPSRGVLVNLTLGARPTDPIDPSRPTVVVAHGLNPFAPLVHFTMAERYAEAIAARYGAGVNVVSWDWNGATMRHLIPRASDAHAVAQGRALGRALWASGVDPGSLHMIGQSSGSVAVAAAARVLADAHGRPVARLTLLDPVGGQHPLIFGHLGAARAAAVVEHYWAPGPSGFGRPAPYPGVHDRAVPGPHRAFGLLPPFRTDHLHTVRWHIRHLGN